MKFSEYNFKPSDVIEGLNAFYKKDEENKNCKCPPFSWRMGYSKYACHFFNIKTRDGKSYKTFENVHLEEAITWLREECDIFYQPGMTWEDLKYKMPLKAVCDEDDIFRKRAHEAEQDLAELREKVRNLYIEFHGCWTIGYSHVAALDDVLEDYKKTSKDLEHMNEQYSNAIDQCRESQSKRSDFIRELFGLLGLNHMKVPAIYTAEEKAITEAIEKLKKDYDELGKAYSSILKWNNSYAEVRRLLGVSADADAEVMISAVKLLRAKDPMNLQKQNDDLIAGYNQLMSYKIQIEKELHKKDLKLSDSERRRKMWMVRYESEHKRANGEHRRAEGCFNDIAALKTQVSHLMRERDAMTNEEVGLQSLKNAVRKLQGEKNKVIEALGQDIWDDAVK